jgi:hypothetical protein
MAQPGVHNAVIPPQRGRQLPNECRVGIVIEFSNNEYQATHFMSGDFDKI